MAGPTIQVTPLPILIRGDVTYLRQDFSVHLPVPQPPGRPPQALRFDYLVRTRPATAEEARTLPAEREPDWGLVFHRIQALRRAGKTEEAAKVLLGAPTEEALIVVPDEWWTERRANAYEALKDGNAKLAYSLVREAGPLSDNPLKDQSFMAGWLALRYLKDAKTAERHFQIMNKAADGPLSRAKARYWLGRTAEAQGDKAAADEYYRQALSDPDTFHALLARQKLEPGRLAITTSAPATPTADEVQRFIDFDAAKAVVIAKSAGLDVSVMRQFFVQMRQNAKSEGESAMVAHLAEVVGDTHGSASTTARSVVELSGGVSAGDTWRITLDTPSGAPSVLDHVAVAGETLADIARALQVKINSLAEYTATVRNRVLNIVRDDGAYFTLAFGVGSLWTAIYGLIIDALGEAAGVPVVFVLMGLAFVAASLATLPIRTEPVAAEP